MAAPICNIGWTGERTDDTTVHATNPPPEGQRWTPLCGTVLKNEMTTRLGDLDQVTCTRCLGTLDVPS
jgi:hypothetical protein